jgi:photosynthetic reaction center cytochrome c subunit
MTPKRVTYSITSLMCAVLFVMVVLNKTAATANTAPAWSNFGTSTIAQAQGDQPVERTRKNIQVLKGLPESQLFLVMNFVATSLGVQCEYCHVKNPGKNPQTGLDNWVWESDDKPKKLMGRRMMKMVLDINGTTFSGENAVTCYTCHRGSTVIARVPPLPPHEPTRTEAAATLPTAEQILAKYIAAVGGAEAVAKFKTTVMKGTIERTQNRNAQLEVTLKDPGKYLVATTTPQDVATLGVNGDTVWIRSKATGARNLSGRGLEQSKHQATVYYSPIKVVDQAAQMKVLGTEKIGDRDTYVVAFALDPDRTRKLYFDTQTGLLLRELTTTRTLLAPLPEQVDFDDYRDVDGIKLPFTIRSSNASTFDTATRRFTEIKHNVAVHDDIFILTSTQQ